MHYATHYATLRNALRNSLRNDTLRNYAITRRCITQRLHYETISQNTTQRLHHATRTLRNGILRLVLVSPFPDHPALTPPKIMCLFWGVSALTLRNAYITLNITLRETLRNAPKIKTPSKHHRNTNITERQARKGKNFGKNFTYSSTCSQRYTKTTVSQQSKQHQRTNIEYCHVSLRFDGVFNFGLMAF
jgi:hypothetical protein